MNLCPLVTIAIPFYNPGEYLKYAVKSVLSQTYANWELILLNDGSTDNYKDIISEFEDKRIRFINDGYQLGLPARLNQLSLIAHGEYYARMDADDIMHPQRIELQVEFLVKHPEIDVVGSNAYYIDKDNSILGVSKELYQQPKTIADILNRGAFVHPSILGKKEWFIKHPYNEKLLRMQDLALWISSVGDSYFFNMSDKLLFYRAVGVPSLSRYLKTQKYFRGYLRTVRERDFHYSTIYKLYMSSLLKSVVYSLFSLIGRNDLLIRKRYSTLNSEILAEAKLWLQRAIE